MNPTYISVDCYLLDTNNNNNNPAEAQYNNNATIHIQKIIQRQNSKSVKGLIMDMLEYNNHLLCYLVKINTSHM
jgi:hypothetical protein